MMWQNKLPAFFTLLIVVSMIACLNIHQSKRLERSHEASLRFFRNSRILLPFDKESGQRNLGHGKTTPLIFNEGGAITLRNPNYRRRLESHPFSENEYREQVPVFKHFEQYGASVDSPGNVAKEVALTDEDSSKSFLKEFARFKKDTASALPSNSIKDMPLRSTDSSKKTKRDRGWVPALPVTRKAGKIQRKPKKKASMHEKDIFERDKTLVSTQLVERTLDQVTRDSRSQNKRTRVQDQDVYSRQTLQPKESLSKIVNPANTQSYYADFIDRGSSIPIHVNGTRLGLESNKRSRYSGGMLKDTIIIASRRNATPRSSVMCFDSNRCQRNDCPSAGEIPSCSQQLQGSKKVKGVCDTVLQARTCVYRDLYYDSASNEFLFYAPDKDVKLCAVLLRGSYLWQPKVVHELPQTRQLGELNRTIQVDQIHHPCFAHAFLENSFMLYWSASEYFGRWDYNPSDVTRFIDGHLHRQHKRAENRFRRTFDQSGKATDFYGRVHNLLAQPETLFAGHRDLKSYSLSRFHTVLVGGSGGRTIWNHRTYSTARPALKVDAEFSNDEKSTAFLNFFDHLARTAGYPSRSVRAPDEMQAKGLVLVFNREGKSRSLTNANAVLTALKGEFGSRVHPNIVTPQDLKLPDIIGFMRKVSILITPHGAQIGNAGFMLPGSGLIEVQAHGCFQLARDPNTGNGNCYMHFARFAGLNYVNIEGQGGLSCSAQKSYSVNPRVVVETVRKMIGSPVRVDISSQLRKETLRQLLGGNVPAPPWSQKASCSI